MDQQERRLYLINELVKEDPRLGKVEIPQAPEAQKRVLRSLMNIRPPRPAGEDFLRVQDEYLQEALAEKGITDSSDLEPSPLDSRLYLWRGDITTLRIDAIVNAANSGMTGCYVPCHGCIDNCIHTYSGIQLRLACGRIMEEQGHGEPTGKAKITPAFNLPSDHVIHTVGPIVYGPLTQTHCRLLADCYRSCLETASEKGLKSIAFCCISTGEFHFPQEKAARIAVETVREFLQKESSIRQVVFNVFKKEDYEIYKGILG